MEISNLHFKTILDEVSDPILVADPEGSIIYANKAFEALNEFTLEEIKGQKAGKLWGGLMPKEFYEDMWITIKHKKQIYKGNLQNKKKSGQIYQARLTITPIVNAFNEILYFIGTEKDITHSEEQLRLRNEFISIAAHQMRSPLTAIKWNLELLESSKADFDDKTIDIIKDIAGSNDKLIRLVDTFLDVTTIEEGKFTLQLSKVRIRDFLDESLKDYVHEAVEKRISTVVDISPEVGVVNLDRKLVGEALANLYSNAIKYTPEAGKVLVKIEKAENNVKFSVRDTGFGIPEEEKHNVFNKFFRASNIKKYSIKGTGIGLYVAKMIVNSCGGEIGFESEINKGTTFWFTIPQ